MKIFYTLGVNLYTIGVHFASLWNSKARKWVQGRRGIWKQISEFEAGENVIWFHCASLGEFEQGRPIMEEIRAELKCQIVLTFFSPSGYEVRKNYEGADLIIYLPKDSKRNAKRFLNKINPTHVFFVKYEFWANYILGCKERSIPIYSVSALFRKDQIFFKGHGGYMRKVLESFTRIYVQNKSSQELLKTINIDSVISGDTRFDRVMKNAEKVHHYDEIAQFCGDKKVFICGSVWSEDLEVIKNKIGALKDWKIIIAPHEISETFIERIAASFQKQSIRYSQIQFQKGEDVLIIDNIGMLMNLYQYGNVAYVGGGFKTGLHNILEPAAFGLPVIYGNNTDKFPEAKIFIDNGIGFSVSNEAQFSSQFDKVVEEVSKESVKSFMTSQRGATTLILKDLIVS